MLTLVVSPFNFDFYNLILISDIRIAFLILIPLKVSKMTSQLLDPMLTPFPFWKSDILNPLEHASKDGPFPLGLVTSFVNALLSNYWLSVVPNLNRICCQFFYSSFDFFKLVLPIVLWIESRSEYYTIQVSEWLKCILQLNGPLTYWYFE